MNKVLIFAGAGISAESGLATFRDIGGLWTQYDINEVCNIITFKNYKNDNEKRKRVFDFYNLVKEHILKSQPNLAHKTVAKLQKEYGTERVKIFTANIDDLFERGGCEHVCHVHGEIFNTQCLGCGNVWSIGESRYNHEERCPKCNSRQTKPHIVFFNELAPMYNNLERDFHLKRRDPEDIILYVGSSMSVIPPSRLIKKINYKQGAKGETYLLNLEPGEEDNWFKYVYYGRATQKIEEVCSKIKESLDKFKD